jgi:hypothetical protein
MPVVVTMDQKGDTKALLKQYDIVDTALQVNPAPPKGMLAHFCLETPDGIRISNVWETEADATAGLEDPALQAAFRKAGITPGESHVYPVHNHFITSELPVRV